jgi:hypothetical protein
VDRDKLYKMMDEDDRLAAEFQRVKRKHEYQSILSDETLDFLAKDALLWHRDSVIDDIIAFEKDTGYHVHVDDYHHAFTLLRSFNHILEYFGERPKSIEERERQQGL